ncbi:VTT domain-containing protein [Candidatus Methylacidithermus pantelleriae]|uniref:Protein DedA n=1 Tax=Candidatus Methylacidithermus pantelleriae TaxID=2744239 RepID=A0A8J2BHI7_9BACT|nr:VTT domain-containing protein [Candidatus Methylacidithermus pantelleriae]CAF0689729.1 Protein DedA [Candidatus Methylacidithermus pantelleriae]
MEAYLRDLFSGYGLLAYLLLFLIIFCETGLVVTPFLPGDSLLFTAGAMAAEGWLEMGLLFPSLVVGAILGDSANYALGAFLGPQIFHRETGRWLNKRHLYRAQRFYERHGGKTIFLARFVPILRTFAPFVAGIGRMRYVRFFLFNVFGALAWVGGMLLGGFFFGNLPWVRGHFEWIVLGIIAVSLLPLAIEGWRTRNEMVGQELSPPLE